MLVHSAVFCAVVRRGRILPLGRINGFWWRELVVGVFCCTFTGPPLWSDIAYGAEVVTGGAGGLLVHSTVVWTVIRRGRILAVGRPLSYKTIYSYLV